MNKRVLGVGCWVLGSIAGVAIAQDVYWSPLPIGKRKEPVASREYLEAIHRTASMVGNGEAQQLANQHGLNILNLTWEDMGRYKNSAVGPNITDMTIQVGARDPRTKQLSVTCMPVIRYPNFSDKSCDLDPKDFTLLVGNQKGGSLKRVSLYDFLQDPTRFLTNPRSWLGNRGKTLLAPRDTKVLVSAQACFLPIPRGDEPPRNSRGNEPPRNSRGDEPPRGYGEQMVATFNPVVFNYQSYSGDPAVLTILATREGTSVTVIDNKRDAFETGAIWGQRLFHNQNGMRSSLTGQRLSEFKAQGKGKGENEASLNMVLLIQVPLKQKNEMRFKGYGDMYDMESAPAAGAKRAGGSDVEAAVIGHGDMEGPFTEFDNLNIQRDERYPIRVTVQFYKATSNGIVDGQDMKEIKDQIDRVYELSDYVGSLVTEGETGRATEYEGLKRQPADWWERFWERHEANTGDDRRIAVAKLRKLLGRDYMSRPVSDLYLRNLLRKRPFARSFI